MEEVWEVMEDISLEAAEQDISVKAAKQDISMEKAKKDEGGDADVPLKEHSEAARKNRGEKRLNLEDLVTGKKKSLIRKMHGYNKNVDEQV